MSLSKPRVAIIGAGASGLPSARWALNYDVEPVVFEEGSEVGGLWRYKTKGIFKFFLFYETQKENQLFP